MRNLVLVLLALLVQVPTSAWAEDSLKEAIQGREDQWSAAYNANDATALAAIYEKDATLVPPGMEPVVGREAIAKTLAGLFPTLRDLALVTDEARPLGENHAVEIGHSTYQTVAKDGSLSPGIDNYVVVWHKGKDGVWSYVTDIFNSR
jgi:uncharacterized protein (TIGR02246 family)